MIVMSSWAAILLAASMAPPAHAPQGAASPASGAPLGTSAWVEHVQQRVVKLHGASGGRERGYGSGVLVSTDGLILTTPALLLESAALRVMLPDGRRFPASIVSRSDEKQLVLLDIEADGLPCFELGDSESVRDGDWLLTGANAFKVAEGAEPVSVTFGVLAGRATVDARRRAQDFPYRGPALLLDMIVATPGSAGGAVAASDGRLVGIIGRPVVSARTNTWLNYAVPAEVIAEFLAAPRDAQSRPSALAIAPSGARTLRAIGLRTFDVGIRNPPPFIESVMDGSRADAAGIAPGDLVLSVGERAVNTCEDLAKAVSGTDDDAPLTLILKRGQTVLTVTIPAGEIAP